MFCTKCGAEVTEGAAFCPSCGTPQSDRAIGQTDTTFIKEISLKSKPRVILICGLALVTVLAVVLFAFGGSNVNKSPETVTASFFEAVQEIDVEKMMDCMPDALFNYLARQMGVSEDVTKDDLVEFMQYSLELQGKSILPEIGEIVEVTFEEYVDVDDLSQNGASKSEMREITNAATVKIKFQMENEKTRSIYVTCVEIDDGWYIWDMD